MIEVNPNRTVKLKPAANKSVIVPFDAFSDEDVQYLNNLLAQLDAPDPVSWEKMNELFGRPLWNDGNLWDDRCEEVAE